MKRSLTIAVVLSLIAAGYVLWQRKNKLGYADGKSAKVDLPDGVYNIAEVVNNEVKVLKADKSIYTFVTSQFMLRNLYINPVKATVTVKNRLATVNLDSNEQA